MALTTRRWRRGVGRWNPTRATSSIATGTLVSGSSPRTSTRGAPGGFFLLHEAFGRVGEFDAGAIEVIGYDEASGAYTSPHLFDSQGNVVVSRLVADGNTWTYEGETTRSTVEFSADHRVQTVVHERTDDGTTYVTSMRVILVKVDAGTVP